MRRIKDVFFVIFCALVVGCSVLPQYREYRDLHEKFSILQTRCDSLESENAALRRENVQLLKRVAALEK